jgi:hypothetical protein
MDVSNSLIANIYSEMRSMKFVDVASSLNFLLFLEDERKVNKFIDRLSTIIQMKSVSKEDFETTALLNVMKVYTLYQWGSNEFWKTCEGLLE